LAYAGQIYFDFSGYSDMAIGLGLMFGFEFLENFRYPYIARSIQDFWRRWHISLSTWLRDYLYISLGGNRRGRVRTYVNLLVTMLLGGLWHGANWTFVVWGGMHGAALAATRFVSDLRGGEPFPRWTRPLSVIATFHFVTALWILFRAESFAVAWTYFGRLTTLTTYHPNLDARVVAVLAIGLVSHYVPLRAFELIRTRFMAMSAVAQGIALFVAALTLREMASASAVPFVYFQF
jgi:D-alanyl-lipoteichoic acid acyltransferase DltB (MBOAT superfamily)